MIRSLFIPLQFLPVTLVLCLVAPLFAADPNTTYEIRLQRPFTAGQSFSVSATNTQRTSQGANIPGGQGSTSVGAPSLFIRRALLDAVVRIEKVDAAGETQASVTINKLELQTSNGTVSAIPAERSAPATLLPPGTELLLTYAKDQTTITLKNKQPLSTEALTALLQTFQKMAFADAMHGTPDKKKVGDSWPISTRTLPTDRTNPQAIDPSQISGNVTLKSIRPVNGIDCMLLECSQTIKDLPVAGATPKEATSTTTFSLTLPTAVDKPLLAYSVKVATHIVTPGSGTASGNQTRDTVSDSEVSHDTTWIPR